MYKNYIFDLYGTLADIKTNEYTPAFWKKIAALLMCYGAKYTPAQLKCAYQTTLLQTGPSFPCAYPEFDVIKVFQKLLHKKGISCPKKQAIDIAYAFRTISRNYVRVYDGVYECLQDLKAHGKSLYLLSNAQETFTYPELEMLGLTEYFDDIFLSSGYGVKKPDPLYYQALIQKHHLNPKECLMIGNDPEADIRGGLNAGMDTLYFHSNLSAGGTPLSNATYSVLDGQFTNVHDKLKKTFK